MRFRVLNEALVGVFAAAYLSDTSYRPRGMLQFRIKPKVGRLSHPLPDVNASVCAAARPLPCGRTLRCSSVSNAVCLNRA